MFEQHIEKLLDKARNADKSEDALRFSQSACNVVNTIRTLREIGLTFPMIKTGPDGP